MEMERINEDTIRVVIGNDDLNERGIRVLDLLGIISKLKVSSIASWRKLMLIINFRTMMP